jgi:DNA-binding transcriptional MerR regulator
MNNIKSTFSIKNLETFSGIKAHTLRIWEKRYNLLEPERTETNIRRYSLDNLRKLLNVTLLYNHGFKISKISCLSLEEISVSVSNIALKENSEQIAINALKLAMINFDCELFNKTYDEFISHSKFEFIFMDVFMPLMKELGILWQTGAISATHEHFITNLIKQKIHVQTERVQLSIKKNTDHPVFVLFLPENEIHELGILYLNYLTLSKGLRTILLGQSIQISSLENLYTYKKSFNFVTYLTVEPNKKEIMPYLNLFNEKLLLNTNSKLIVFGPQQTKIDINNLPNKIELYRSVQSFISNYLEKKYLLKP